MTPASELDRLFGEGLVLCEKPDTPLPEVTEHLNVDRIQTGNSDLRSERGDGPNPDGANTLPIYPNNSNVEIER